VLRLFRQALSVVLVSALVFVHAASFDLHVHAPNAAHQHGPALHHHDAADSSPSDEAHIGVVDDRNTVIHVRLSASSPSSPKPTPAAGECSTPVDPGTPAIVNGTRIVARAHGPPAIRPYSLRAPPARSSL
jgi:hypothetical protein